MIKALDHRNAGHTRRNSTNRPVQPLSSILSSMPPGGGGGSRTSSRAGEWSVMAARVRRRAAQNSRSTSASRHFSERRRPPARDGCPCRRSRPERPHKNPPRKRRATRCETLRACSPQMTNARPRRICASAILRLIGAFVRIVAAFARANSASGPVSESRAANIASTLAPANRRSIAAQRQVIGLGSGEKDVGVRFFSPPPCGEGSGVGVARSGTSVPASRPSSRPSAANGEDSGSAKAASMASTGTAPVRASVRFGKARGGDAMGGNAGSAPHRRRRADRR